MDLRYKSRLIRDASIALVGGGLALAITLCSPDEEQSSQTPIERPSVVDIVYVTPGVRDSLKNEARAGMNSFYEVAEGDQGRYIAKDFYGDERVWGPLRDTNRVLDNLSTRIHTTLEYSFGELVRAHQFRESYLGAGDNLFLADSIVTPDTTYHRNVPANLIENKLEEWKSQTRERLWKEGVDSVEFKEFVEGFPASEFQFPFGERAIEKEVIRGK